MGNTLIGSVELGNIPRIVAIVDRFMPVDTVIGLKEMGADLLEIRLDRFSGEFDLILDYVEKLKNKAVLPIIGTIRETEKNRGKRLVMFERITPFVDAIDIEVDADINRAVISRAAGKTIIVSEHDFEKTPGNEELSRIVDTAKDLGADIVKIAVMANCKEDVTRLLNFTEARVENLVTIALGEIGKLSRITAPLFGSLFTYAFFNDKVAPGQLSLEEMVEEMKKYYPDI